MIEELSGKDRISQSPVIMNKINEIIREVNKANECKCECDADACAKKLSELLGNDLMKDKSKPGLTPTKLS